MSIRVVKNKETFAVEKKMGSTSIFKNVCLLVVFILVCVTDAHGVGPPKVFNVMSYGAVADGNIDNSQAFLKAWNDACRYNGRSRVLIPWGTYMLNSVSFEGSCKGSMVFVIKGILKAPTDPALFFTNAWIAFRYLDGLDVKGGGYLDGQGASAWPYNDCFTNPNCKPLPTSLRFDFINNSRVRNLRSIDSKNVHINLFACNNMNISHVRLTAPSDSRNTDGIHIGVSSNIRISRAIIGTGDDCISMVSGSQNIDISGVSCGPGHGISVGSLGKSLEKEYVTGVTIRNCNFSGTQNGVRIKTWAPSFASQASDFTFENIVMKYVFNPIVIDQQYCPVPPCNNQAQSAVQISNVTFRNIWGISNSKVAVNIRCSGMVPCQDIKLSNIDLVYNGFDGPVTSSCSYVNGKSYGKQLPSGCL